MLQTPTVQRYPSELLSLISPEGFERAFWELYRSGEWQSRRACFDALQDRFEYYFGYRKYSEYASFCNQIARRHGKKTKA